MVCSLVLVEGATEHYSLSLADACAAETNRMASAFEHDDLNKARAL